MFGIITIQLPLRYGTTARNTGDSMSRLFTLLYLALIPTLTAYAQQEKYALPSVAAEKDLPGEGTLRRATGWFQAYAAVEQLLLQFANVGHASTTSTLSDARIWKPVGDQTTRFLWNCSGTRRMTSGCMRAHSVGVVNAIITAVTKSQDRPCLLYTSPSPRDS